MRNRIFSLAIFTLLTFTIPMFSVGTILSSSGKFFPPTESSSKSTSSSSQPVKQTVENSSESEKPALLEGIAKKSFKVLDVSTGKVEEVAIRDYIRGALAAEMPANFQMEALKAQAVSAHSYALFCSLQQQKKPDSSLKGADLSADFSQNQGYITEKQAKKIWGDLFDVNWARISEAADSVLGYVMAYDGQPILAAYHSTSAGITEAADQVWSASVPYLVPVESKGDILAPGYESTVAFTTQELKAKLTTAFPGISLSTSPSEWIKPVETSSSGYHTAVTVGDKLVHGKEVRAALGLRSSDFSIAYANDIFTFHVVGYGHGVGLSQYGADYMARQGSTFDEILTHYYPGATLSALSL